MLQECVILRIPHGERERVPVHFHGEVVPNAGRKRCGEEDVKRMIPDLEGVRVRDWYVARRISERGAYWRR